MTGSVTQKQPEKGAEPFLQRWKALYGDDLRQVDAEILRMADSHVSLIPTVAGHIINSGGKRLRPILTLLSSRLCGYEGRLHVQLAACIEFIHTATLLHDDVVDESALRRGFATANNVWGNAPSVLVGDYLLARAFQLMAATGSLRVMEVLADTSAIITEGEVHQLMCKNNAATTVEDYLKVISAKTAQLFAAAAQIGPVISNSGKTAEEAMIRYGRELGIAFQIVDDLLDYGSNASVLGKTVGDDFREGKVTLPLIYTYQRANAEEQGLITRAIEDEQQEGDLEAVLAMMQRYNVLPDVAKAAQQHAQSAIQALESFEGEVKTALLELAEFSVERTY